MKWQAGIILGSVDFLGNPLGFVNDVSEGFSGLIYEGNLAALVRNVAHGLSNSTAKFTGNYFVNSLFIFLMPIYIKLQRHFINNCAIVIKSLYFKHISTSFVHLVISYGLDEII